MRLVFLGSPDAAIPTLRALVAAGHDVALVLSGPDRRRGRGGRRTPTPLKAAALELGLPVSADLHDVVGVAAELGVVVAFGRIIPAPVLAEVPMVNLHFSLLPRWRGAAPVERAILAGDDRSGVCVMEVAGGLDTGDVLAVAEVPIDDEVTAAELTRRLAVLGADLMVGALAGGLDHGVAQSSNGVTYAHKITAEDRRLDWVQPASVLQRTVRIGGAWTTFRGARLKVIRSEPVVERPETHTDPAAAPGTVEGALVACGAQSRLRLLEVQPEGRSPMDAAAWARGARPDGERLGELLSGHDDSDDPRG